MTNIPVTLWHFRLNSTNQPINICSPVSDGFDPYSNVYTNQSFDPEADDYPYEPTEKADDGFIAD